MNLSPPPSIRSVLSISLPLIAAGLATNLTIFADRIILADYSVDMMSHVTTISNHCWIFLYTMMGVTYISKVFVGQYNGSKQYHKTSEITWQMIILSLFSIAIFLFAYSIAPYLLPKIAQEHGLVYFRTLMLCGVLWPISSALCGFFIGTYQSGIVFFTLIISNAVNIIFDLYWIPDYGTYGAALATDVSMVSQIIILFYFYLQKSNHEKYNTRKISFNPTLMSQAFNLGYPEAISHFFEMGAWAAVISIIAHKGPQFLLVSNLGQNIFILFMFVYSELGNGVKTIAANYIGENRQDNIPKLIRASISVHITFVMIITALFIGFPDAFVALFSLEAESTTLKMQALHSLKGIFAFLLFDGLAYIIWSILAAYGDTFAGMVITGASMWFGLVLPTYLVVHYLPCHPATHALTVLPFYGVCITTAFIIRYKTRNLSKMSLIATQSATA